MSPEKQRLAVAGLYKANEEPVLDDLLDDHEVIRKVVTHARDNLMSAEQWEQFGKWIEICHPTEELLNGDRCGVCFWAFATITFDTPPRVICEALLRAMSLWEQETK